MVKCVYCGYRFCAKAGIMKRKMVRLKQRYRCSKCQRHFVKDDGFKRFRHSPEVITTVLDLRAKGMSLADIVDHLDQFHSVKVSRKTVLDWEKKFGKKLESFTQTLTPQLGGVMHADEMFLKARKQWVYYWGCIDYDTKFLVAEHLSEERSDKEAISFLQKIKIGSPELPTKVHTDNSYDYPPAFRKVFPRKRIHEHYPAWKKRFKNNPIERWNNTGKQSIKTFRNFHNPQGARTRFTFFKNYYNYIRKHTTLQDKTPAQACKITLNLGRNRWKTLIEKTLHAFLKARIWQTPQTQTIKLLLS